MPSKGHGCAKAHGGRVHGALREVEAGQYGGNLESRRKPGNAGKGQGMQGLGGHIHCSQPYPESNGIHWEHQPGE